MWIMVLIPNLLWVLGIFAVLAYDKFELKKKILYILILNFIFMFSDVSLGKEFLNDESIEYTTMIIEIIQIGIIAFWVNKMKGMGNLTSQDENVKFDYKQLIPYLVCIVLSIGLLSIVYFLIFS